MHVAKTKECRGGRKHGYLPNPIKNKRNKVKGLIIACMMSAGTIAVSAASLEEARQLMVSGDYSAARKMAESLAASDNKLASTSLYNYIIGVCDFEEGDFKSARKRLEAANTAKGGSPASLYLGRLAFLDYDFEKAQDYYGDYRNYREKSKQPAGEMVEELEAQLEAAENALERVEKVTVLDSIAVPAKDFFRHYKLPASAGKLLSPEEMPLKEHRGEAVVAFMNEGGDFMMWGAPDSVGNVSLVESIRLTDGTWQEPTCTPAFLSDNGYADYPFMMPDGVTLYYASDGDGSIGGYDIFVVTRDAQTGEYLQPQNIGMPFNSPYDDFMLAIDEENGVGWWATDRNELGDKLTIYVYKVNDVRKNYDPDDEEILDRARLTDYRATQDPDLKSEYKELLDAVYAVEPGKVEKKAEFYLPKGDGEYYTSTEDFKNSEARGAVKRYLLAKMALDKSEADLKSLRERYRKNRGDSVREMIQTAEAQIEGEREQVRKLRSEIYRLEK